MRFASQVHASKLIISHKLFLLLIALSLAAFTHLWNPIGFPSHDVDEGIYMRRAMHVLAGLGPQEIIGSFTTYDHPYFGQLFLAGTLSLIGYPNSLDPLVGNVQSIQSLYLAPKLLMGFLAIIDTLLVFEISQRRYNKTVALIGSILFAVTPFTLLLRPIWLDSIQLPFILSSILCAVCLNTAKQEKKNLLILLSGIFLGIAIFTKVPAITMIPVILFLVITNSNRNLKTLRLWFIPVILIPMIWPLYSIYLGQFSSWMLGLYVQSHREGISLFGALNDVLGIDLIISVLGISGIVFAALKKDLFILLWAVPLLIFFSFSAGISYFHLIPIFPALCVGAARMIEFSRKFGPKKIQPVLPIIIISPIGIIALITTATLMATNLNSSYQQSAAFLSQYLNNTKAINDEKEKITVISDPYYLWIPQYVFHLDHDYVPFYMLDSIETDKVLFVVDKSFLDGLSFSPMLKKIYNFYTSEGLERIDNGDPEKNGVIMKLTQFPRHTISEGKPISLVNTNHTWSPFGGAKVSQVNNSLHVTMSSNNTDRVYGGAVLGTHINLKDRPLLLHLEYESKSITGNSTFFVEITDDGNEDKTFWDYIHNTLYTEVTEDQKGLITPWNDLEDNYQEELIKGKEGGKIIWNGHLKNTFGNHTSETFIFPRFSAIKNLESATTPMQVKFYFVPHGIGVHELTVSEVSIR